MTSPAQDLTSVPAAVSRYATAVHGSNDSHHVASPLGAWLLLATVTAAALAAGPIDPERLAALERQLGMPAARAGHLARQLLAEPPAAVRAATAVWHAADEVTPGLRAALDLLEVGATTGPIPSQDDADDWAARSTDGQIREFPISIQADTVLLLATALATTISWDAPFGRDEPAPTFAWSGAAPTLMRSHRGHRVELWRSSDGLLAAHEAHGSGLRVLSVLTLDPDVSAARVLEHAHTISRALAELDVRRRGPAHPAGAMLPLTGAVLPLSTDEVFDLPLSEDGVLRLSERRVQSLRDSDRRVEATAWLPAWSARTRLEAAALPGLLAAGRELGAHLASWQRNGPADVDAVQSAVAAFDRYGFRAAAVTAMAFMAGRAAPSRELGLLREVDVTFAHPYAVVASSSDRRSPTGPGVGLWHGVPVFSAWVSEPNPEPEPEGQTPHQ